MSCGVSHRHSLDPVCLWLWCMLAVGLDPYWNWTLMGSSLAWELPFAAGATLKKQKKKKSGSLLCSFKDLSLKLLKDC